MSDGFPQGCVLLPLFFIVCMNCIDSESQVIESLTGGSYRSAVCSLRIIWYCVHFLTGSSTCIFSVFCCVPTSWNETQHKKDLGTVFLQKPKTVHAASEWYCSRPRSSTFLTGVICTNDGRRNKAIDPRIGTENLVIPEVYRSVVIKRELPNIAKLSAIKSVFVPILTYGHEFWAMIEGMLSEVLAAKIRFWESLRRRCDTSRQNTQLWNS